MKKRICLLLISLLFLGGCGKDSTEDVIGDFKTLVSETTSYTLKGNMEIYADEDTYTYSLEVSFLKDNFYKVVMVNQTNNHEQIILRNNDAVYVITPSLNKSFKFQSEWPNNSSQAYLLSAIISDIEGEGTTVSEVDGAYVIQSTVNYPNNPDLTYQKTTVDADGNIKKNEVYDEEDKLKIKVTFTSVNYKANLKETDFALEDYITDSECEDDCEVEETSSLDSILYPLYVPSNTYLSSSDKVSTDTGDRIILTFAGDKNFVLVEEVASVSSEFEVIPVYGDPLIISDTLGVAGTNSLSWTKDNISYYLIGDDLSSSELLLIGESIGYSNLTVSKEK